MTIDPTFGSPASAAGAAVTGNAHGTPKDQEPEWKKEFRQTLQDILDAGGFASYAKKIQEQKIEEMRKKILSAMGLSEDDLAKMSADQRNTIEKMINDEIRKRLAAETALKHRDNAANGDNSQGNDQTALTAELQASPGQSGTGAALLKVLQAQQEADSANQNRT